MRTVKFSFSLKRGGGWILCFLGAVCFLMGVKIYGSIKTQESSAVFLSGTYPDRGMALDIIDAEREGDSPVDVCFLWDGGICTVRSEKYGTQEEAMVCGLLGDASLYDNRIQGFSELDKEGCIVDEETAYTLFGSKAAAGSEIFLKGEKYVIRGIVPWKQRIMIIRPKDGKSVYTRAFVRPGTGETAKAAGEAFLLRNGFSGITAREPYIKSISFLFLFFPLFVLWLFGFLMAWRERKELIWKGMCVLMTVFLFFWLSRQIQIPRDWIPGKWSDFSFWSEKWKEEMEGLRMYLMLPKTPMETEQLLLLLKTAICSFATLLLCLLGRRGIMGEAKTNKGGLQGGIPGEKN